MILDVAFEYAAEVRPKGRRKFESRKFLGAMPIIVDEVSPDLAPIAFWHHGTGLQNTKDQIAVRAIDGELYEAIVVSDQFESGLSEANGALRRRGKNMPPRLMGIVALQQAAEFPGYFYVGREGAAVKEIEEIPRPIESTQDIAEVSVSHRSSLETKLRELYAQLRIVDGVAYRRIECPVFSVDPLYTPRIVQGKPGDFYSMHNATTFRVDRFDDARAVYAKACKQSYVKPNAYDYLRPDVIDASLIAFDEVKFLVEAEVERVMGRLQQRHGTDSYGSGAPHLAATPRAVLTAFVELRDAVRAKNGPDVLMPLLLRMAEALGRGGMYRDYTATIDALNDRLRHDGFDYSTSEADLNALEF